MARHDDGDVPSPFAVSQEMQVFLTRPFLAVCGALLAVCGVVVGLWSQSLDKRLIDIANSQTKEAAELEKVTDDHERRLRNLEERSWRNGLK